MSLMLCAAAHLLDFKITKVRWCDETRCKVLEKLSESSKKALGVLNSNNNPV